MILEGDCLEQVENLEPLSIQTVVTSPPYCPDLLLTKVHAWIEKQFLLSAQLCCTCLSTFPSLFNSQLSSLLSLTSQLPHNWGCLMLLVGVGEDLGGGAE